MILAWFIGSLAMMAIYFIGESLFFTGPAAALAEVPFNAFQALLWARSWAFRSFWQSAALIQPSTVSASGRRGPNSRRSRGACCRCSSPRAWLRSPA